MIGKIDFSRHFDAPEELARQVLQVFYNGGEIRYPIDPFKLLSEFGIVYQLRDFDKLEGIYIVPEDENDIPIVGINNNRPVTRQRFTAAHEICHHIKDKTDIYCPIKGIKNAIEKFADRFAAALLMPIDDLKKISDRYLVNGWVEFEDALQIADYFGVSFEACVYRLAYDLHRIQGDNSSTALRNKIRSFHPQNKRIALGLEKHDLSLLRNIIDSYELFIQTETAIVWHKFKINFVYNENRMEGLEIDHDEVSEIVTDLRLHKHNSAFCNSKYKTIIEVCGHSSIYDYIHKTEEKITAFGLLRLNQMLYQFSPYPEGTGSFRQTNAFVLRASFETSDYHEISAQIRDLDQEVQYLVRNLENISLTDFIERSVHIHHRMTVIHPFMDGNGRVSRAFLNWLFRLKGLPPVYIKCEHKQKYFDALSNADMAGDYDPLVEIFYREVLRSMFELNSKFL